MKTCVYTAVIGGYDALLEQPVRQQSDAQFICFTDDKSLSSDTWEIVHVEPHFAGDPIRSARMIKALGHPQVKEFDASLWVDATVLLKVAPEKIIGDWLGDDADVAFPEHSFRETVLDEFDEVVAVNRDRPERVYEQLLHYAAESSDILAQKPLWTAIIARRHGVVDVDRMMRVWFDHILRYSRRDQLSIRYALGKCDVRLRTVELNNFESEIHEWPKNEDRKVAQGLAPALSGPLLAELRRAQRQIGSLEERIVELRGELMELRGIRDRAVQSEQLAAHLRDELIVARDTYHGELEALHQRLERESTLAATLLAQTNHVRTLKGATVNAAKSLGRVVLRRPNA